MVKGETTTIAVVIPADTDAPGPPASDAGKPEVWAVVEDKRKTKTKKPEPDQSAATAAAGRAPPATAPASTPAAATSATAATSSAATTTAAVAPVVVVPVVPAEPVDFVKSLVPVEAKKLGAVIGAKGK